MDYADIDEVLFEKTSVIFATDQRTFEVRSTGGMFGVLVPLMTIDGRRFDDPKATFSNRGRVWWMLRHELRSFPTDPGTLWTGALENAVKFEPDKPEKDRYQVDRDRIEHGVRDWVDVLDVQFDAADLDRALSSDGIEWKRPPLPLVVVRGRGHVTGPFKATWDASSARVRLAAVNAGKPMVWRAAQETLGRADVEEFRYRANLWNPDERPFDVEIRLVRRAWLGRLEEEGDAIDAASDEQVIKWALEGAGFLKRERSEFRAALDRVSAMPDLSTENPGRLARFKSLCERSEKVVAASREVAELVAQQPAFADLVRRHADTLAAAQVEATVKAKSAEIERGLAEATARRDQVQKEIRSLEALYDQRRADQDAKLRNEHAEAIAALEKREADVAKAFEDLRREQQGLEQRLREVVELYETRGREFGNQIVAQFPVLQRLALSGSPRGGAEAAPAPRSPLPAWLSGDRPRGGLSEEVFLAQFKDIATRRGFVFSDLDLANFHISVKTGFWTVLAGPSGTGKTSLPRLYSEALGAVDEHLSVPVKPDWLDDRDVIGGFNSLTGRFEPGSSGLVDHLIAASVDRARGRGGVFLVTLDEMNLARVEHYFAQFLSVADGSEGSRRIVLYARGVDRPADPYAPYRELPLGDNVRFVGTVNIDETTHFFSPKVLDRAAVLILEPSEIAAAPASKARAERLDVPPVHGDEWRSWVRGAADAEAGVREFLLTLDRPLRTIRSGLAFRLRDRVLSYVASARGLLSDDQALDLAIAQSVLPRLRTQNPKFLEAAEEMLRLLPGARFPRSSRILTDLRDAGGAHDFFQLL